jgi:hypothetical protein
MNSDLVLRLVEIAISLVQSQAGGSARQDASAANTLLALIQKGVQAYEEHTGKPLDPALIKAEARI